MPADANLIEETLLIKHEQALRALSEVETAASRVNGMISTVKAGFFGLLGAAGIGGLSTTAKGLLEVNNAMEQTTTVLAGMLQANKFAKTFQDGMELSAAAMAQIRKEAEKLPGTDVDFLEAFKVTFQGMKDAGMTELPKMITFSDNLVAVAKAYGIDSAQAARDISLMLGGHAGEDVKTFRILKGQMGVKGTDEFNKLSSAERVKRLSGVMEKNKGMLKAFENTWDSISSTTESIFKNVSLAFGEPIFNTAKAGLKAMNDLLGKYSDQIKLVAGLMGNMVARGLHGGAGLLKGLMPAGRGLLPAYASGLSGMNYNALPGMAGSAAALLGGPLGGGLVGGLFKAINQGGSDFSDQFIKLLTPLRTVITNFTGMWEVATDRIRDGFLILAGPVSNLLGTVFGTVSGAFDSLKNVLSDKEVDLKMIFTNVGIITDTILTPAIRWVGEKFIWLADFGLRKFITIFSDLTTDIATIGKLFSSGLWKTWLGTNQYLSDQVFADAKSEVLRAQQNDLLKGGKAGSDTLLGKAAAAADAQIAAAKAAAEAEKQKKASGAAKPPPPQVNFHNAKFSIEQSFASGFDPDRVATAFRRDIGNETIKKVDQSGLTPLFTPT